jgi:hypothetical protein
MTIFGENVFDMKKIIYAFSATLIAAALFNCYSCNKIKDLAKVNFSMDNSDGEFVIPAIVTVGEANLGTDDIYMNLDSIIKAQNSKVGSGNIKEVKIKSCELSLTNGDSKNNFSALESCKLEIKSNVKADFIKMAAVSNNPDVEAQTLNLPVESSLDLKDYFLSANQFTYRISGKSRKTTDKDLNCKILVKYTIVAGL